MRFRTRSRRYVVFALVSICGGATAAVAVLLAADLYAHRKYETTALVNVWGYRGRVAPPLEPGSTRVVVLGGSTAFGYGPDWNGSFPYLLEQRLNASGRGRFSVVNLAYNNEGAYAMRFNLEDYEWLQYHIALLYAGYNDLGDEPNRFIFRRRSSVFRLTGYLPILPTILDEKAQLLRGDAGGPDDRRTTFTASLARATTAAAMQQAAATVRSLEDQLGKLSPDAAGVAAPNSPIESCPARWHFYCASMADAIRYARSRGASVIVGTQPFLSDRHVEQQRALAGFLQHAFGEDPNVVRVDASTAIDLSRQPELAYDGMHLTEAGNAVIADLMVNPVLDLAHRRSNSQ